MTALDLEWRSDALCRGENIDLFYPADGVDSTAARSICCSCPAREPCLEYAIAHDVEGGIWGALNETERRQLRRERVGSFEPRRDAGHRPGSPDPAAALDDSRRLTAAECDTIRVLHAYGLSAREIAHDMFVARRTVQHVIRRGGDQ